MFHPPPKEKELGYNLLRSLLFAPDESQLFPLLGLRGFNKKGLVNLLFARVDLGIFFPCLQGFYTHSLKKELGGVLGRSPACSFSLTMCPRLSAFSEHFLVRQEGMRHRQRALAVLG